MLSWSILLYFWPSLSYNLSLLPLFCLFLSGCFRQVLLYWAKVIMQLITSQIYTKWCRTAYVRSIAQLIMKNLYCTENMLSAAWFSELLTDWTKGLFVSKDLMRGLKLEKVHKSKATNPLPHTLHKYETLSRNPGSVHAQVQTKI